MAVQHKVDPQELARLVSVMGICGGPPVAEVSLAEFLNRFLRYTARECCGECMVGHMGTRTLISLLERGKESRETLAQLAWLLRNSAKCDVGKTAGKVLELLLQMDLIQ
ncbi:NADH-ubiquinone oxidoreductase-F iron-sulfur binding region domain-containing protein [Desulfothermobacter acidiphilus]|uniref:NADH-ubiquinone oxidoreductase-F iron-sulfur binding region domain-containing protein n=1 Tax=Desulfothermobacter acidiphilus TaxID=1938353 RepID=UPI003F8C8BF1